MESNNRIFVAPKRTLPELIEVHKSTFFRASVWLAAHLFLLATFITHQDIQPVILRRYSLGYALMLAGLAIVGGVGTVLLSRPQIVQRFPPMWLQSLRRTKLFAPCILLIGTIILLAIWSTPFNLRLAPIQNQYLSGYGTLLVFMGSFGFVFWRGVDRMVPLRLWVISAAIICFVVFVISVSHIDTFPKLNTLDELHNWSAQWTFAHTGLLGEAMFRQMVPLPQPILDSPHYVMGFMLRFFGDTLWQSRFARMLLACLSLPFIYLCGKRMYGPRTGVWAVVVAALLIPPTAYVRPDVFVGVMLSVALYIYWRAQTTRRPWMHYLTGLAIALAGEGHPLAYRFGLAFALIYVVRWVYEMYTTRRIFLDGRVVALMLGGFTGMLIYLSIHILPNVEQGLHFALSNIPSATKTLSDRLNGAHSIVLEQIDVWLTTSPLELVLVTVGAVFALRQNKQADRLLLTLLVVSEVLMMATYGYYRQFYQVHYLPIFALLAGRLLANLNVGDPKSMRQAAGRSSAFVLSLMIFVVALILLAQDAQAATVDPMRTEFTAIGRQLKADLPRDAVVVGNEDYFLEYRSMNFYGIETVTTPFWYLVKYQGIELWDVTKPDVFVISRAIDIPKYTDFKSIYAYMGQHNFQLVRCYTHTGLIEALVYVRELPPGWTIDPTCSDKSAPSTFNPVGKAQDPRSAKNTPPHE